MLSVSPPLHSSVQISPSSPFPPSLPADTNITGGRRWGGEGGKFKNKQACFWFPAEAYGVNQYSGSPASGSSDAAEL